MKIQFQNVVFTLLIMSSSPLFADSLTSSAWHLGKNIDGSPMLSPLLTEWRADEDPNLIFYSELPDASPTFNINEMNNKFVPLVSYKTLGTPIQFTAGKQDVAHLYTQWSTTPIYVDFGGSYSEGQVLAPPPGLIRAAHIHGTKVLGSIFFSPSVYGGDKELGWLNDMLTPTADGHYVYADQLIAIAHAYHFDGYFINQEAVLFNQQIDNKFVNFIEYIQNKAPDLIVDWYQVPAYTPSSKFLLHRNEIFLDYYAPMESWVATAGSVQFPLENIEYGINGSGIYNLKGLMPYLINSQKYHISLGHFAAENIVLQNTNETSVPLKAALERIDNAWNGDGVYAGINAYMHQQFPLSTLPFYTNFNIGQGNDFHINGLKTDLGKWSSMELQTLLPTLRHDDIFSINFDLENVFSGGNSVLVSIKPHQQAASYELFKTQIPAQSTAMLSLVYQNNSDTDQLCVRFVDQSKSCIKLKKYNHWKKETITLENKWIEAIEIESDMNPEAHQIYLGEIYIGKNMPYTNLKVNHQSYMGRKFIRWDKPEGSVYFDIYTNENRFVARTYNSFYCIDGLSHESYSVKPFSTTLLFK